MNEHIIDKLRSALQTSENLNLEYKKTIQELTDENNFLSETITINRLGKITAERRELKKRMQEIENDCSIKVSEAEQVKKQYNEASKEAEIRLRDIKEKQSNIDCYIDKESDKKIEIIKDEYRRHEESNDKKLSKHIAKNDKELQKQKEYYRAKHYLMIYFMISGFVVGIVGIIINIV